MSLRYAPSTTEKSASTEISLRAEPVVPDSGCPDQVCVLPQRRQGQLRFFRRNKATAGNNDCTDSIQKQCCTVHNTAAEHDNIGNEHGHQIGETETEIAAFVLDSPKSPCVTFLSQLANLLGRQVSPWVFWGRVAIKPFNHGRTGRQRFPTSSEATQAAGTGEIDQVVPYFRMRSSGTTINLTVENDARTNAGAHGDINQTGLTLAGTPAGFAQGRSIGIVFHGHGNVKDTFQIPHRIRASPVWKEIDITNFTGNRIHGPRTADADTSDFRSGLCSRVAQHCCDAIQGAGIAGI